MKKKHRWFFYIRGSKLFIVILMVILLIFSGSVIWAEIRYRNVQLQNMYEQENDRLKLALEKELNKCVNIARNLTIVRISVLPENYTPEEYRQYYAEIKQVAAIMLVSDQIASVRLKYREDYIEHNTADTYVRADLSGSAFSCDYNANTQLFFYEDEPKWLYMRYVPASVTTGAEEVWMKLSLGALSENCVQDVNDEMNSYLVSQGGAVLVASSYSEIGKNIQELYGKEADLHWEESELGAGLTVLSVFSTDYYSAYLSGGLLTGGVFCIIFFMLVLALIYICYRFFIKPIENVLESIGPEQDKNEYDKDVLNYIGSHIARLHGRNMDLDEKIQQALKELKWQQLVSFQLQIKPHFLSNTLSAISWMAMEEYDCVDNPISRALTTLSDIYQSSLASDEILVTVEKEKRDTEKYIQILMLRYGDTLSVDWEVEEELMHELILKNSIQPLVENCVGHAFDSIEKEKRIHISVKGQKERIVVSVTDNGIGIPETQLIELRRRINDNETQSKEHVGLKNINRRVKLLHGEEYGLFIKSVAGEYTNCYFEYPKGKTWEEGIS